MEIPRAQPLQICRKHLPAVGEILPAVGEILPQQGEAALVLDVAASYL